MANSLKFPLPEDYKPKDPAVFCPAKRVIGLYNQSTSVPAKKIAKKVRKWFTDEAHGKGWAGVSFLPEVQSQFGAGCILWRRHQGVGGCIVITEKILVLHAADEES